MSRLMFVGVKTHTPFVSRCSSCSKMIVTFCSETANGERESAHGEVSAEQGKRARGEVSAEPTARAARREKSSPRHEQAWIQRRGD